MRISPSKIAASPVDDFRDVLRRELAERCRSDARYSQRAFARDLALAPNRLSEILRAKQGMSRASAERVAAKIGLSGDERDHFVDLVESRHARSEARRRLANSKLVALRAAGTLLRPGEALGMSDLTSDTFRLISDWYHLAILELLKTAPAKKVAQSAANATATQAWIGRVLGISSIEASLALGRLERLGFLRMTATGLKLLKPKNSLAGGTPSAAVRDFHRQVLERATSALATQSVEERELSTSFLAIERHRLPEAKALVREFWEKFQAIMAPKETPPDDVYCLAIQLFHLTQRRHLDAANQDFLPTQPHEEPSHHEHDHLH